MRRFLPLLVSLGSLAAVLAGISGRVPLWWAVGGGAVVMVLVWPVAVAYANTAWPLSVTALEVLPPETQTRPASDQWGREMVARLAVHGFVPRARYRATKSAYIDFGQRLDNETTGEVVLITVGPPSTAVQASEGLRTITFFTRFKDGGMLTTSNSPLPGLTPALPGDVAYRLPDVTEVDKLYTAHRRLVKADGRRIKPFVLGDDPLAWEREANDRSIAIQVAHGLAARDEKAGVLCQTLKGAIRAAWLMHPWIAGWHRRRHTARAMAALASAPGASANPSGAGLAVRRR